MRDRKVIGISIMTIILSIVSIIITISNLNRIDYHIGKIESIELHDGVTTIEVSPVESNLYFVGEIKSNHEIEYDESIGRRAVAHPTKMKKTLKLGELSEIFAKLSVGDNILFKVNTYDKNNYKLIVKSIAIDLTIQ